MARMYLTNFAIDTCYQPSAHRNELAMREPLLTYDLFSIEQEFIQCALMIKQHRYRF